MILNDCSNLHFLRNSDLARGPENARDSIADSFARGSFAHLKINHRFERMRLRGLTAARDEFHLAAIVQNLKTLANYDWRPPSDKQAAACVT
jgi:hypothetical protein